MIGRKPLQKLPEAQLKHFFMQCANSYLMRCEGKQFEVYDTKLLNGLFLYFTGSPDSPYDLRKGLWLSGALGVGKTTLVNVFREFLKKFRQGFLVNTASVISDSYCATGCLDTYISNKNGYTGKPVDLCIDELGREQIPAMHFGSKLNVMQYVLHQRYSLWQSGTALTHVTTNLTASDVLSRYDDFIFDRCRQMFNIINISGHSKR